MENTNSQPNDITTNNSALGYGDMDSANENAYWRDNYKDTSYYNKDYSYDKDYEHAYAAGYEGRSRYSSETQFENIESDLEALWNQKKGDSIMPWSDAHKAANDAWNRFNK